MHLLQAIKMASKSLWSNKLRSFLTMLGIIIGVMTVALLTSVASGVSDAVVSSIRSQSTLSIIMNTSTDMSHGKITKILTDEQPDQAAADYYQFSVVKSADGVVSKDLTGISKEVLTQDPSGYFNYEVLKSYSQAEIDAMKSKEEQMFAIMHNTRKKARPTGASVYAVDKNFASIYDVEIQTGAFPTLDNEILVDIEFVKSYLGEGVTAEEAVGQEVSIGTKYYNQFVIKFSQEMTEQELGNVCDYLEGKYITGVDASGNDVLAGRNLTIIKNDDKSRYVYNTETKELVVNVELFQNMTNQDMLAFMVTEIAAKLPDIHTKLADTNPITITDIYDPTNSKLYVVSGVLSADASMFMGMGGSTGTSEPTGLTGSMMNLMMSHKKGTCYMLLDNSNLAAIGEKSEDGQPLTVANTVISYAYIRYKTEDVMSDSTTKITLALMQNDFGYMTDFMIISMDSVANIVDNVMDILTTMLTVISIVSLIVGGIGIMNIMLVAVTERTREIGVRKAIGAKRSSILTQFLVEALMLSLIGGAIGLAISAIGCFVIGNLMGVTILMPFWVIAMSLGFCTAIGLIFGMFPAIKASRMQPIDALRRE